MGDPQNTCRHCSATTACYRLLAATQDNLNFSRTITVTWLTSLGSFWTYMLECSSIIREVTISVTSTIPYIPICQSSWLSAIAKCPNVRNYTWMAKCNQLTPLPFKGLTSRQTRTAFWPAYMNSSASWAKNSIYYDEEDMANFTTCDDWVRDGHFSGRSCVTVAYVTVVL